MPIFFSYVSLHLRSCSLLLFVVDLSDVARFSEALVLFLDALAHPDMVNKPILLVLNKLSVAPSQNLGLFKDMLDLEPLLKQERAKGRRIESLEGDAVRGTFAASVFGEAQALLGKRH